MGGGVGGQWLQMTGALGINDTEHLVLSEFFLAILCIHIVTFTSRINAYPQPFVTTAHKLWERVGDSHVKVWGNYFLNVPTVQGK